MTSVASNAAASASTRAADSAEAVNVVVDVAWAPQPNTLTNYRARGSSSAPGPHTSVNVALLSPSGVVLVHVASRGWDLTGGHLEVGESYLEAAVREVGEEAGIAISPSDLTTLGWSHLHVVAAKPDGYGYPHPDAYQPVLAVTLAHDPVGLTTRVPDEISDVAVIAFDQVEQLCATRTWLPLLRPLLAERGQRPI